MTIVSFVALLAMFKRPFYGVISYLIIMMVRPGLFFPVLGRLRAELLGGIIILIVIVLSPGRMERIQVRNDPICKWMFLLVGIMTLSMLQAFDFATSWDRMYEFYRVFAFFLMIITLIDSEKDAELLLLIFGLLTVVIAYDAIYNYMTGNIITDRIQADFAVASQGMGSGHVALANIILQGIPFIWYLAVCNKTKLLRPAGIFFFLICLYGVIISASRGGFVGLVVLSISLAAFSAHRALMIFGTVVLFLFLPMFGTSGYMDYMNTMLNFGNYDVSSSSRIDGLIHGVSMVIKRPLLGVGPGCYPLARKAWFHWGLWSHNHYGQLLGELGLIGVVVWFAFLKSYLRKAWDFIKSPEGDSRIRNISCAILVATVVRLVLGMGSHSVYIFFWYMLGGIIVALARLSHHAGN